MSDVGYNPIDDRSAAGTDVTAVNSTLQLIARQLGDLSRNSLPGNTLSTTASPQATVVTNLSTSSVQVIGSSTVRRGLSFFQPNPSGVNIWLMPGNLTAVANEGILLIPGSSWSVPTEFSSSAAWNAIAATGSSNVLTIVEFY
jgi:hypothetical protein